MRFAMLAIVVVSVAVRAAHAGAQVPEPRPPTIEPIPTLAPHPPPAGLRVTRGPAPDLYVISWEWPQNDGSFQVSVSLDHEGTQRTQTFSTFESLSFVIPPELVPACPSAARLKVEVFRISVLVAKTALLTFAPCELPVQPTKLPVS